MQKLFPLCLAAASLHAADRWLEITIAGQPSGYQHLSTETLDGGAIRTTLEQIVVINRLGSKVEMKAKTQSVENAAGELTSVREETTSSQQTTVTEAELKGDRILFHTTSGANTYDRFLTLKAPVCGPESFARSTHDQLKKPNDSVTCRQFAPSLGVPYRVTRTLLGEEVIGGQTVLRVKTATEGLPDSPPELLDREGQSFRSEMEMPFGKMVVRQVDRETALRAAAGGELPAEAYDQTMARSNIRVADARSIDRIKLKLTHKKPELGWPAFRGPSQTIVEKSPSTVILEVTRPELEPTENAVNEALYLKPNQILQSDDPEVLRLAREVSGGERDRLKAARKLQDWVAGNLQFDLGIAVAPASEVVRNRRGTCIAYSVLLASMARAVGIPSRLAMGLVYVGGIWGGHAWVEILVDGQWLPIDSAVYRPGFADPARIQFDSYTGQDNLAGFSLAGLQVFGNVDIAILDYTLAGKTIPVPESTAKYSVSADEYRNSWLGFSLRKPERFAFAQLDAVYPDPTIAQLQLGASKVTVSLLEAIANQDAAIRTGIDGVTPGAAGERTLLDGRAGVLVSSPVKAKLLMPEGQSLWVLTAEGSDARGLLNQIAGGWKWLSPR